MELSIVTTVYKSEHFLEKFISELMNAIQSLEVHEYELIFVIDGITDNSIAYLKEQKKTIQQIRIVELSRNFGHHIAASAGLLEAKGETVFIIDCDLEVSPSRLVDFFAKMKETNADVVYGVQTERKGRFIEKWLGGLFWSLFNSLSDIKVPPNIITERLMNRNYLNALISLKDKNVFMAGLMYWVGFNQVPIEIKKELRDGKSSYGFNKRAQLLIEAITSFSDKPLRILFQTGVFITFVSFCLITFQVFNKILHPEMVLIGFTSLIISIFLTLGILTTSIGLLGIYLSKIFREVKDRPRFIIKQTH